MNCLRVLLLALAAFAPLAGQTSSSPAPQKTARIEITEHKGDAKSSWDFVDAADKLAWPITVLILALAFYKPVRRLLEQLGLKGGEISIGSLSVKFPELKEAALDADVTAFQAGDAVSLVSNSAKTTLLNMLREPGRKDYIVISLGEGAGWLSSRLFIFALMLQRMKGLRSIVFLDGSAPKFLGTASPEHVRWALAREQPWLEKAYVTAMGQFAYVSPSSFVVSNEGALDPQTANDVVKAFIYEVRSAAQNGVFAQAPIWAGLPDGTVEVGSTWLIGADLVRQLDTDLHKDAITEGGDPQSDARTLLQCKAQTVARVKSSGEFASLIDRTAYLNQVAARLVARMDSGADAKVRS